MDRPQASARRSSGQGLILKGRLGTRPTRPTEAVLHFPIMFSSSREVTAGQVRSGLERTVTAAAVSAALLLADRYHVCYHEQTRNWFNWPRLRRNLHGSTARRAAGSGARIANLRNGAF